jgi:hypothetical protein
MTGNPHARETACAESKKTKQIRSVNEGTSRLRFARSYPAAAQRLSCVLGMLSSLEVRVLRPT